MSYTENQTTRFSRSYKKLSNRETKFIHEAMELILKNPKTGSEKRGDLSALFVYKFKIGKAEWLLGYTFNESRKTLTWNAIGQHENFYRDLN